MSSRTWRRPGERLAVVHADRARVAPHRCAQPETPVSDATGFLLGEIARLKAENRRLADRVQKQRRRAEMWRGKAQGARSTVSLLCGRCGVTVSGRPVRRAA